MNKRVSLLFLTTVLSSCSGYTLLRGTYIRQFCIIQSTDNVFVSIPTPFFNRRACYAYLEINGKKELIYCHTINNSQEKCIEYYQNVDFQPQVQAIETNCYWEKNKMDLKILGDSWRYLKDEKFLEWNTVAYVQDANDSELDAKYYAETSFIGLNGSLDLKFKPEIIGYIERKDVEKKKYVYIDEKSSIFTFKRFGTYNDKDIVFSFLEDKHFSISAGDDELYAYGTYVSKRNGVTLVLEQNDIFDIDENNIELTNYETTEFNYDRNVTQDLSKYLNDDKEIIYYLDDKTDSKQD